MSILRFSVSPLGVSVFNRLFVLVFVFTVSVGTAFSQVDAGVLSGVVTDATGAAVIGATVTAVNAGTNAAHTVKTATNGTYQLGNLSAAVYKVSVTATGFEALKAAVEVTVGGHVPLDVKLSAAGVIQTVEVESLGGSQVNTDSPEISEIISPQQVSELPSLTRNVYDFVAISGNISNGDAAQGHAQNSASLGVGYSINGQRSSGTEILLDGVENTELFRRCGGSPGSDRLDRRGTGDDEQLWTAVWTCLRWSCECGDSKRHQSDSWNAHGIQPPCSVYGQQCDGCSEWAAERWVYAKPVRLFCERARGERQAVLRHRHGVVARA